MKPGLMKRGNKMCQHFCLLLLSPCDTPAVRLPRSACTLVCRKQHSVTRVSVECVYETFEGRLIGQRARYSLFHEVGVSSFVAIIK